MFFIFSLEICFSLQGKEYFLPWILLNICKLSYFSGYRCLNLILQMCERINTHIPFVSSTQQHLRPTIVAPTLLRYQCAPKLHQFAHISDDQRRNILHLKFLNALLHPKDWTNPLKQNNIPKMNIIALKTTHIIIHTSTNRQGGGRTLKHQQWYQNTQIPL